LLVGVISLRAALFLPQLFLLQLQGDLLTLKLAEVSLELINLTNMVQPKISY